MFTNVSQVSRISDMHRDTKTLEGFLTQRQLAAKLGVVPRTLYRWHLQRIGPPRISIGRQIFFREQSVSEWLASRELKRRK
jgi:predicted DNA-binding transcriptional regulator AlpA